MLHYFYFSIPIPGPWLWFQNCGCRFQIYKFFFSFGKLLNPNLPMILQKSVSAKIMTLKIHGCSCTQSTHANQGPDYKLATRSGRTLVVGLNNYSVSSQLASSNASYNRKFDKICLMTIPCTLVHHYGLHYYTTVVHLCWWVFFRTGNFWDYA